ncbi:SdiA-regulated domain-containing protein [Hydrogenophaga sp.]|uniref:SdiA-regulated domain-containing protein n=1 Tax=Hydrogenophaga sp. TaxID=1904254 RepID=UPI0025C04CF7|nr:SdiA-regulated domain-containing protein [Hydrogenophaga sp.]MBT9463050.1 SdiA-regulated domain-containing protein [Hydrogenophaga sp.]
MKLVSILLTATCALGFNAFAASSINLSAYQVTGNYTLDANPGNGVSGLEASAVTFARDRGTNGTLFFVGDEGTGVVEISLTGQTLSSMSFSGGTNLGWPTTSSNRDSEGLTYLGNGVLVVAEERLQDAFRFGYVAGGSINLATAPSASIGSGSVGNNGLEGLSYDPRNGSFVSVKQAVPQGVLGGTLNFATGASTMGALFDPALLGVVSLSDVQTLSPVTALAGTDGADNLLILSLDSRKLLEVTRSGQVLSSLDLSGITSQAIEGVTVDDLGNLYLVAEDSGTGNSRLFVLAAPVPEPETYAMLLAGLVLMGATAQRRRRK